MLDMLDLGSMKYFLSLEIEQCKHGIFLSQQKYAIDLLKRFHMKNCKSVETPMVQNQKFEKDDRVAKVELFGVLLEACCICVLHGLTSCSL